MSISTDLIPADGTDLKSSQLIKSNQMIITNRGHDLDREPESQREPERGSPVREPGRLSVILYGSLRLYLVGSGSLLRCVTSFSINGIEWDGLF